jgi:hypothetical protein
MPNGLSIDKVYAKGADTTLQTYYSNIGTYLPSTTMTVATQTYNTGYTYNGVLPIYSASFDKFIGNAGSPAINASTGLINAGGLCGAALSNSAVHIPTGCRYLNIIIIGPGAGGSGGGSAGGSGGGYFYGSNGGPGGFVSYENVPVGSATTYSYFLPGGGGGGGAAGDAFNGGGGAPGQNGTNAGSAYKIGTTATTTTSQTSVTMNNINYGLGGATPGTGAMDNPSRTYGAVDQDTVNTNHTKLYLGSVNTATGNSSTGATTASTSTGYEAMKAVFPNYANFSLPGLVGVGGGGGSVYWHGEGGGPGAIIVVYLF